MTGRAVAWAGLGAGAAVLGVAATLLHRTLLPVLEIRRYADDIAATGERIAANTDAGAELGHLGALVAQLRGVVAPERGAA